MQFRVLGPLEVRDGDRAVPVGTRGKQSALLALLLLDPDHELSSDRLIAELWGERPPPTARKALQVHVAELRKALGPATIVTKRLAYALAIEGHEFDLHRFERLVDEGRSSERPGDAATASRTAGRCACAMARRPAGRPGLRAVRAAGDHHGSRNCGSRPPRSASRPSSRSVATQSASQELELLVARHPAARTSSRPADARALPLRSTS